MAQDEGVREDLRVRRTRKLLQEALIDLTVEKGFSSVTVRDIAERAMVNRATFYRHYQDKYDLLDKYMDDLYALLEPADDSPDRAERPGAPPAGLIRMLEHVRAHAAFYRVMLGERGDPGFAGKIRDYVAKRMRASISASGSEGRLAGESFELCLRYISSASVGAIEWWLEADMPYAPEEMAALAVELSLVDVGYFLSR
jgi:AcrR family transcriptional regulator